MVCCQDQHPIFLAGLDFPVKNYRQKLIMYLSPLNVRKSLPQHATVFSNQIVINNYSFLEFMEL